MAIKVTFYNDVNFKQEGTSNGYVFNKSTQPAAGNFSDGGIYFTPKQDIMNSKTPAPAHIIQKSYIYTLGSYVVNDPNINQAVITKANTTRTSNKLSENDCYVVTDIESDPYNKLLTVKKTNIKLGQIVDVASNAASFMWTLGQQSQTINLGSYSLTVAISQDGILTLSNNELLADEIMYQYYKNDNKESLESFNTGDTFNLSKDTYTLQFTTKTDIASAYITCADAENITFGDSTTKLSCQYHGNNGSISNNVVNVLIPASGWDASTYNANSYTFSIYIKTTGDTTGDTKDDIKYAYGEWNVNVTISKTPSPLTLNPRPINVTNTTNQPIKLSELFTAANDTDSIANKKLTYQMTEMSAQDVKAGWGRFYLDSQQYEMGSAYEMKKGSITVNCKYQCTVNTYSIYHQTEKHCDLTITGGKQWTLKFDTHGGDAVASQSKYYDSAFSLPNNVNRAPSSSYTYTFNGWYTAATGGENITSLTAGGTTVTWNNHAVTLHAKWTETATTKYYWYVGRTIPESIGAVANSTTDKWTELGTSLSGISEIRIETPNSFGIWYVLMPTGLTGFVPGDSVSSEESIWDKSLSTISGYTLWTKKDKALKLATTFKKY